MDLNTFLILVQIIFLGYICKVFSKLKNQASSWITHLGFKFGLQQTADITLENYRRTLLRDSTNPLSSCGAKFFSQADEDGLIREILSRINLKKGNFIEFGVGDGTENNTLNLLLNGWKGIWFGAQDLNISLPTLNENDISFQKIWLHLEAINNLIPQIKLKKPEVVSVDLDGNDYHFCEVLLKNGVAPSLWIQEYNSSFSPETNWVMPYNPNHKWSGSNYYGASLKSYSELFEKHGYFLVVCNLSGSNAFFVKNEYANSFRDCPQSIVDLYMPGRPYLYKNRIAVDSRILSGKGP